MKASNLIQSWRAITDSSQASRAIFTAYCIHRANRVQEHRVWGLGLMGRGLDSLTRL